MKPKRAKPTTMPLTPLYPKFRVPKYHGGSYKWFKEKRHSSTMGDRKRKEEEVLDGYGFWWRCGGWQRRCHDLRQHRRQGMGGCLMLFLGEEQWRKVMMARTERGGLGGRGCYYRYGVIRRWWWCGGCEA